jgi:hypothetical protein
MSDLETCLWKWKIKIYTDKGTAVVFPKRKQVPRDRLKLFEQEISRSAEAKYLDMHLEGELEVESIH